MLTDIGVNITSPAGAGTPEAGLHRITSVIRAQIQLYATSTYCEREAAIDVLEPGHRFIAALPQQVEGFSDVAGGVDAKLGLVGHIVLPVMGKPASLRESLGKNPPGPKPFSGTKEIVGLI